MILSQGRATMPHPVYDRSPLPIKVGGWAAIAGAAAILGYGAWRMWKKYTDKKEKEGNSFPTAGPVYPNWPFAQTPTPAGNAPGKVRHPSSIFDEPYPFGSMKSGSTENISLKSVSISGEVEGLLFSSTIRQEYKNDTDKALEIIYTFPVGWDTSLLGLEATIGEKRLSGEVVKKSDAEERYEEAVADGDSAIMVQQSSRGLYTANLGNIKAGESVVVEIHCARLLRFEQGQVRLCIPTVIGERYGNPYGPGGLATHESASVDAKARYPFALELTVKGNMAKSAVSCPSHPANIRMMEDGLHVSLEAGAVLDRDFILLMRDMAGTSHALCVEDEDAYMVAASFAPEIPQNTVSPLGLKILVDCSGSMSGSSIAEAQKGLNKVISLLTPEDQVAYSRFGSEVQHLTRSLIPCNPEGIQRLTAAIAATDADMGGTEMERALSSTFQDIAGDTKNEVPPVVLLITDGDVWDVKNIIATAKASGHRIFAIGVGYAPAESLLRDMAEQTGGACEFVSPQENMAEVIVRMFHRMRGAIARNIRIEWGQEPVWQSSLPKYLYDGETVHAFALLKGQSPSAPCLSWDMDGKTQSAACERVETTASNDLLRLGRMRQMEEGASDEAKLALALKYQLVCGLTSLILVYERPEGDKLEGLPGIQQVPQMPAYEHGCSRLHFAMSSLTGPTSFLAKECCCTMDFMPSESECEVFSTKKELLEYVLLFWRGHVLSVSSMKGFMDKLFNSEKGEAVKDFIEFIKGKSTLDLIQIMGIFLQWAFAKLNPGQTFDRHSMRLINAAMKNGDGVMVEKMPEMFDEWYANS